MIRRRGLAALGQVAAREVGGERPVESRGTLGSRVCAIVGIAWLAGCSSRPPLFCQSNRDCAQSGLGYCDVSGEFEASGREPNTCIPCPFADPGDGACEGGGDQTTSGGDGDGPGNGTVSLSVRLLGAGVGRVTSAPAGIDCPQVSCEASFPRGTEVSLQATSGAGSVLWQWSGACSGSDECDLTMASDKAVVAVIRMSGEPVWLTQLGSAGRDVVGAIDIADDGTVFVAGEFSQTVVVGDDTLVSAGDADAFFARLRAVDGQPTGARRFGASGRDFATSVAVTDASVFVAAAITGDVDIGGHPVVVLGPTDAVVAGYSRSPSMTATWARAIPTETRGMFREMPTALATDGDGVLVSGVFNGAATPGGAPFPSDDQLGDSYLVRYAAADGAFDWALSIRGPMETTVGSLAVSSSGNIAMAGTHHTSFSTIGRNTLGSGFQSLFAVINGSGTEAVIQESFGGPVDLREGDAVTASDGDGNFLVAGSFRGRAEVADSQVEAAGERDIYLAKFSPVGASLWVKSFGSVDDEQPVSLAAGDDGSVILSVKYEGDIDLGGGSLGAGGAAAVAKYDRDGNHLWSQRLSGALGAAAVVGPRGQVCLGGSFIGLAELGGVVLTSRGDVDGFAMCLVP